MATPEGLVTKQILEWSTTQPGTWLVKIHASGMQGRGIPDILGVANGRMVALEVKRPGGKPTRIQQYRIDKLRQLGAVAGIVTSIADVQKLLQEQTDKETTR